MNRQVPWLRVFVEGVVIVVSILMAFALEAWWGGQQRAKEEDEVLRALLVEFNGAEVELDRVEQRHAEVVSGADAILEQLRGAATSDATVSISALASLFLTPTADPQRGTLDALIASGSLDLIRSQALQSRLADWPAALGDYQEDEQAARSFVLEALTPGLARYVDLHDTFEWRINTVVSRGSVFNEEAVAIPVDHATLPRDLDAINLVETRRYYAKFALNQLVVLRVSFEAVRDQLRTVIE